MATVNIVLLVFLIINQPTHLWILFQYVVQIENRCKKCDIPNYTSATAHQIGELCVWRGERAYRPNDANNYNAAEIEVLLEYLCTS